LCEVWITLTTDSVAILRTARFHTPISKALKHGASHYRQCLFLTRYGCYGWSIKPAKNSIPLKVVEIIEFELELVNT